eukprot:360426-Chlamydomonas_euryale.AAC.5
MAAARRRRFPRARHPGTGFASSGLEAAFPCCRKTCRARAAACAGSATVRHLPHNPILKQQDGQQVLLVAHHSSWTRTRCRRLPAGAQSAGCGAAGGAAAAAYAGTACGPRRPPSSCGRRSCWATQVRAELRGHRLVRSRGGQATQQATVNEEILQERAGEGRVLMCMQHARHDCVSMAA